MPSATLGRWRTADPWGIWLNRRGERHIFHLPAHLLRTLRSPEFAAVFGVRTRQKRAFPPLRGPDPRPVGAAGNLSRAPAVVDKNRNGCYGCDNSSGCRSQSGSGRRNSWLMRPRQIDPCTTHPANVGDGSIESDELLMNAVDVKSNSRPITGDAVEHGPTQRGTAIDALQLARLTRSSRSGPTRNGKRKTGQSVGVSTGHFSFLLGPRHGPSNDGKDIVRIDRF